MKAYVSFVLLDSVKSLYSEFESGFLKLCGGEVLQLFHYQELSALVRGQKVIDFDEFEEVLSNCVYVHLCNNRCVFMSVCMHTCVQCIYVHDVSGDI